tara:strand:- start:840 stop:2501 length:1662 start_codon:yes stop_codon:yes gene_type:complete
MAGRNLLAPQGRNLLEGQELTWAEVGQQAISNVPESGQRFFTDIWNAVRHPIDTGGTLVDVAQGALRLMTGASGDSGVARARGALNQAWGDQEGDADVAKARAVGQFFADRYGTVAGFKRAMATDPVGVLGDFATLLTGGGALAARAPGVAGKVGGVVQKAGHMIDPVMLAGKGAQKVWQGVKNVPGVNLPIPGVRDVLATASGTLTGTGPAPLVRGGGAGLAGGKRWERYVEGMSAPAAMERVVGEFKSALGHLKKAASDSYRSTMGKVAEYSTPLPFDPINKAFREVADMGTYKGPNTGWTADVTPSTQKFIAEAAEIIDEWRLAPKADAHTPMGLDALKQRIWDAGEGLERGSAAAKARNNIYHAIKKHIIDNAPEYEKAMKDYERAKTLVADIEHSLKIGDKHMRDTSIRALTSIMRNNVNTNYGFRQTLAETLEKGGYPTLLDSIAGAAVSSPMPRGMQGATTALSGLAMGGAAAGDLLPWATLLALPLTSPRLAGELAGRAGRGIGITRDIVRSRLGQKTVGSPGRRLGGYQMGRLERDLREKGYGP